MLPISERFSNYSKEVMMKFKEKGIRCEMDERDEKIGYKIREAQLEKVPYMIILGEKEAQSGMLSVRCREQGDIGIMSIEKVIEFIRSEQ
ncbi:MAG: His/Gly/Thr/Pro-type tRNA ligase C-terminal domain-containing protein [Anaerostipes sp.]|nr:His/Gly/Thr/Pro-type tRNA ligase C-terminal domain-containing protein [Massilibacteroides sp.]